MESYKTLPQNYKKRLQLNLETDKHLRRGIAFSGAWIWLIMLYCGNRIQPIRRYFRGDLHQVAYVFLVILLYMILHEMVHGAFMHMIGRERAKLGFHGPFTYASSPVYFLKFQYLVIALAPFLILGTLLAVLSQIYLRTDWFWTFYFVEIVNITGAVSDLYVVLKFLKLPANILVRDMGTSIVVYEKG